MISSAKKQDFDEIKQMFNICFPTEDGFNDYFFDNIFDINNTLVYKIDQSIVSMLQMIEFDTNLGKCTYIYGACTLEKYRKRGLMAKLLEESFEIGRKKNHNFSILIPAEDYLFDFYSKFNYKPKLTLSVQEFVKTSEKSNVTCEKITQNDVKLLVKCYNTNIKANFFIKRNEQFFTSQIDLFCENSYKFTHNEKIVGYAFGYLKDDKLILEEILAQDISLCLNSLPFDKISYKTLGNQKFGMILSLKNEKEVNGYINLMYN